MEQEQEKRGFWAHPGNRLIVWTMLIAVVLSASKAFLPEPYPQLHSKAVTAYSDKDYNAILKWTIEAQKSYPDRYVKNQLGYYRAFALNQLGEYEKSQQFLNDYLGFTTGEIHGDSDRLMADNHLALGENEQAIEVMIRMYKSKPFMNQHLINEMLRVDENLDLSTKLDPSTDEFAYDIYTAKKANDGKTLGFEGIMELKHAQKAIPMRHSTFFSVRNVKVEPQAEASRITGEVLSRINLSKLGFRATAFSKENFYMDEVGCEVTPVVKGQGNLFECLLPDPNEIATLHFQELRHETK